MKVCLNHELINKDIHLIYGEEKAKELGYIIVEVPQGYEDCCFEDFDNNVFNVGLYNKRKQTYKNQEKIAELTNWFDNYFDKQIKQSLWQEDFTISHDDYFDKDYGNLDELKRQANEVRTQIKVLRQEVNTNE